MKAAAAALCSLLLLLTLASCRHSPFAGVNDAMAVNSVTRAYEFPTDQVWRAVTASAKELELAVDKDVHDALGGELTARRANRDRVTIHTRGMDPKNTMVTVGVDPGDRNLAEIIHGYISERLRASK